MTEAPKPGSLEDDAITDWLNRARPGHRTTTEDTLLNTCKAANAMRTAALELAYAARHGRPTAELDKELEAANARLWQALWEAGDYLPKV